MNGLGPGTEFQLLTDLPSLLGATSCILAPAWPEQCSCPSWGPGLPSSELALIQDQQTFGNPSPTSAPSWQPQRVPLTREMLSL